MIETVANIAILILVLSTAGALYRAVKGPSLADRVIALDTIAIDLIGIIAILSIIFNTLIFVDVILVIGILGLIGTVALSKFLIRGAIIDRAGD